MIDGPFPFVQSNITNYYGCKEKSCYPESYCDTLAPSRPSYMIVGNRYRCALSSEEESPSRHHIREQKESFFYSPTFSMWMVEYKMMSSATRSSSFKSLDIASRTLYMLLLYIVDITK